jgi:uncharacterized protein YegJ (DUF2314 family)
MNTRPVRRGRAAISLPLALVLVTFAGLILAMFGCDRKVGDEKPSAAIEAEAVEVAPAPADQLVTFEMALYLLSPAKQDLPKQLADARAAKFSDIAEADPAHKPDGPVVRARVAPLDQYAPPGPDVLRFAGHGLTPAHLKKLADPAAAWVLDFACPPADALRTVRRAGELMLHLARNNDAVIWDELTREVFAPDALEKQRLQGWDEGAAGRAAAGSGPDAAPASPGIPDVSRHVTVHYYTLTEGRPPRAITLGMAKFGCPDVVMQEVPRADSRSAGGLMNLVCQTLVERGVPPESTKPRAFKVDLEALKHREVKTSALAAQKPGGSRAALLTVRPAKPEEGDPDNRLLELTFDRQRGKTAIERQAAFLVAFSGAEDKISMARDNDAELNAARDRARAEIQSTKKPQFRRGLPGGEVLMVKAPFKTDDNSVEWMWVEVLTWDADGTIHGTLQNQPAKVAALHPGSEVTVLESDLFDYIHRKSDGTTEGNETGKILAKQGE